MGTAGSPLFIAVGAVLVFALRLDGVGVLNITMIGWISWAPVWPRWGCRPCPGVPAAPHPGAVRGGGARPGFPGRRSPAVTACPAARVPGGIPLPAASPRRGARRRTRAAALSDPRGRITLP